PTAMLDPKGRKEIMATIKALNKEHGITVILITHYMEEAAQADRVVVIDKGKILLDDVPKKIFSQVDLLKSVGLDVPQATELMYDLRKCGVDAPSDIIDVDECAEYLFRLLSDKE
ncbi:MAG: energy-coupling factor transporter ATPase, partial [Ruminiclostridium sp.]|nr:energy-coupling factor transporter ATPase [Ruminiclostridium sp.]